MLSDSMITDEEALAPNNNSIGKLLDLSLEVDKQMNMLKGFLGGSTVNKNENQVVTNLLSRYHSDLEVINQELTQLSQFQDNLHNRTNEIYSRLRSIIEPKSQSTVTTPQSINAPTSERRNSRFATPLRLITTANAAGTPRSMAHEMDFDNFPSTPTLEQVGLSRETLEAVGYHSVLANRSSSDIDGEISIRSSIGKLHHLTPNFGGTSSDTSMGSFNRLTNNQSLDNSPYISSTPTVSNVMKDTSPFGTIPTPTMHRGSKLNGHMGSSSEL